MKQTPYTFRVEHYRDFNTARNEADDSSGWPGDYDDPDLRKFFESTWESTQMANNPISATSEGIFRATGFSPCF